MFICIFILASVCVRVMDVWAHKLVSFTADRAEEVANKYLMFILNGNACGDYSLCKCCVDAEVNG